MSHPSEQELVMFLLGDEVDRAALIAHVDDCPDCEAVLAQIRRVLDATAGAAVPEPDSGFEGRVWEGLRPRLRREGLTAPAGATARRVIELPRPTPSGLRRWLLPASMAAMLVVAFLIGRWSGPVVPPGLDRAPGDPDRVLLVAVGDHLERSRMVLVEVLNAEESGYEGLGAQRTRAESLLADNRLYRQTATLSGHAGVADVLDEIERILLELAYAPRERGGVDVGWLQERIRARDLLFKVSVVEGQARQRATPSGVGNG